MLYTAIASEIVPVIAFFIFFKEVKHERTFSFIPLYSLLFFTSNIFDLCGVIPLGENRRFFYGFITLFEYVLFSLFFLSFSSTKIARNLIKVLSLLFIIFLVTYTIFAEIKRIDSVPIGVETLLILIYSFYYLFAQVNNPKVLFIYNQYQFWVVIGMMLYLSGSFFVYIFANQLPFKEVLKYWFIIDIFMIIKNIFFTIAIVVFALQQKKKTPQPYRTLNVI